jgi:hypothetical protein
MGEGSASGLLVGMNVGVFKGVGVAGVTIAVCVPKKDAAKVPTLCVRMALTSGVGGAGACPPQEPNRIPVNNRETNSFRVWFMFTSV